MRYFFIVSTSTKRPLRHDVPYRWNRHTVQGVQWFFTPFLLAQEEVETLLGQLVVLWIFRFGTIFLFLINSQACLCQACTKPLTYIEQSVCHSPWVSA